MHHCQVLAYTWDGEVWCPDCGKPKGGDEEHGVIFAGDEREEGDTLYCRGCDSYFDEDWGGWLKMDRRPYAIIALEEAVYER